MYAPISAMRSTRYPLAGLGGYVDFGQRSGGTDALGCPCSAPAATSGLGCGCGPVAGLGQVATVAASLATGFGIAAAGGVGFIMGYWIGKHAQKHGLALNRGRRRRHR